MREWHLANSHLLGSIKMFLAPPWSFFPYCCELQDVCGTIKTLCPLSQPSSSINDAEFLTHFCSLPWGHRNLRMLSLLSWVSMILGCKCRYYLRSMLLTFLHEDYSTNWQGGILYKPFGLPRRAKRTWLRQFLSLSPLKYIWSSHCPLQPFPRWVQY